MDVGDEPNRNPKMVDRPLSWWRPDQLVRHQVVPEAVGVVAGPGVVPAPEYPETPKTAGTRQTASSRGARASPSGGGVTPGVGNALGTAAASPGTAQVAREAQVSSNR